jgi:hypothetical protein
MAQYLFSSLRVDVPHLDFIAQPPGSRVAFVVGRDESTHYIDVMLVQALEVRPPVTSGQLDQNPNSGE